MPENPLKNTIPVFPRDTSFDVARVQIEGLRRMGSEGRARQTTALCRGLRNTVKAGIRDRHPEYDDRDLKLSFIRLTAGESVFQRLFPGVKVET